MSPMPIALRNRLSPSDRRFGERSAARAARRDRPPSWRSILSAWLETYRARRRLLHCLALDPRFARDIGLTPEEVAAECRAPFWTALPRTIRHMTEMTRW